MPERSRTEDTNKAANRVLRQTTGELTEEEQIQAAYRALAAKLSPEQMRQLAGMILGQHGGKRGGKARAETLSAERRSEIARRAAEARWK